MSRVAVILCGGRGRRLGALGQRSPKALVNVNGAPLLWYTILQLHAAGFRHFVLPLGYRGEQIQGYIDSELSWLEARIDGRQTGENTSIGGRLHMVHHLLPNGPFLLVNGDCLFDLDFDALYSHHEERGVLATLTACRVISQYGLIVLRGDDVVSFARESVVRSLQIENGQEAPLTGYVNAGLTLLDKQALAHIDLRESENLEIDLFSQLIEERRIGHMLIDRYWYAIETEKDLEIANSGDASDPRAAGVMNLRSVLGRYQAMLELGLSRDRLSPE